MLPLENLPGKDYESAHVPQMEQKGAATGTRGNRDEMKAVLRKQLFKNLLTIAVLEMDPDRATLYFSQNLLEDPEAPKAPTP